MTGRLQEIKERFRRGGRLSERDKEWLIDECERLRDEIAGGNDGLPANPEFDIDNDDGSF